MNNPSIIPAFNYHDMVQPKGEEVITTSRNVAEYFGKRHGDVLRKIEQVKADCSADFSQRNFASADYVDEQGKLRPMVSLTKDGWIMVVMGFTGKAAAAIKESYIAAFNWMADMIRQGVANLEAERNAAVLEFMKEKDVASMSGRLLNRWGRVKKPQLLARIERIEKHGQITIPGLPK